MKNAKTSIKNLIVQLIEDESGQGIAEYVLLLVVVIAIAMMFKNQIVKAVQDKMGDVTQSINGFQSQ